MALAEFLKVDHAKLHSVVMFWGGAEFKTPMPANVLARGYASFIKSKQEVLFSDAEVTQLAESLRAGMLPQTRATRTAHIQSLKERQGSTTICPKCGLPLVQRTAKSGPNAGRPFLGCSGYPKCKHTKGIGDE
jgi:restriction system protein